MSSFSRLLMLPLLAVLTEQASAQTRELSPRCDGKFGLCRYVTRDNVEVIPARFERAMPFSERLAAVRIDGQFGYIDQRGEIVIKPQFDLAGEFSQGLAEILVGGKTGIVDRAGTIVVPPQFQRAIPLTKDVIVAAEGQWRSGYYPGSEKLPGLQESSPYTAPSGLYHIRNGWMRRPDLKSVKPFGKDGLIWATTGEMHSGPFGLMASDGTWVVEPEYNYAATLTDGRAVVRKYVGKPMASDTILSGAVDDTGRLVIPLQSWAIYGWRNGWARVQESYKGGKQALMDKDGKLIGGRSFDKVEWWEEGDVAAVVLDGRTVGLTRSGEIVAEPRNGRVIASCPAGLRLVRQDGKIQITGADGKPTTPLLFDDTMLRPTCDKPYSVRRNGKWGFVRQDGRLLTDPPEFEDQHDFRDGIATAKKSGVWGTVDMDGRFKPKSVFDDYREKLVAVLDKVGWKQQAPTGHELDCKHGLRLIERNGNWGIADGDRNLIEPRYRAMSCFGQGVAWAPLDARRQWCPVGPDGALRDKPACRTNHYPYFVTHSMPERFDADPYENSVLWTRAYLEFGAGKRSTPPRWVSER